MKIVVCVNPTTGAAVSDADAALRAGSTPVSAMRTEDTHAVEEALRIAERLRAADTAVEIAVVTLAPAEALGALRQALALGADRAVLLDDATVRHLDLASLAHVVAGLLTAKAADLYLTCTWSGDSDGTLLWLAAGEALSLPVLTGATTLDLRGDTVRISRQSEGGDQVLTAPIPCLVEVTTTINQARYPTIKGRAAAQNKPLTLLRPADVGVDTSDLTSRTEVIRVVAADAARDTVVIDDPASAPEQIVAFLRDRRLA